MAEGGLGCGVGTLGPGMQVTRQERAGLLVKKVCGLPLPRELEEDFWDPAPCCALLGHLEGAPTKVPVPRGHPSEHSGAGAGRWQVSMAELI